MDNLRSLKKRGNKNYLDGNYQASCVTYGQVLSEMMKMEQDAESPMDVEFNQLKSVLFSNLAAANLKLHDYEAVRRCCNAAIVFLNDPELPMMDLGLEERDGDNILDNAPLKEPIAEESQGSAAKILYRRSCALYAMATTVASLKVALEGVLHAKALQPKDTQISDLIAEVTAKINSLEEKSERSDSCESESDQYFTVHINPEREGLMINGGPCLKRKGHWSQTVESATAYIPLVHFLGTLEDVYSYGATSYGIDGSMVVAVKRGVNKADLTVVLEREGVSVVTGSSERHYMPLEYYIDPTTSTWQLDALYTREDIQNGTQAQAQPPLPPSHLVLHLTKTPSVEWFPGCEWWTGVFSGDEAIDTATCSVGTDSRQLPDAAVARAEGEHKRFLDLGDQERKEEREGLMRMKRNTVEAVEGEERALQAALAQQPGRAEMLGALSSEFPGIFFGASTQD